MIRDHELQHGLRADEYIGDLGDYSETKRKWYENNKERAKATAKAWRLANPERHRELKREWARRNRVKVARKVKLHNWRKIGIPREFTHEKYEQLFDIQGGRCAICDAPPTPKRGLSVDHEHLTGRVRGLLCTRCNMGIGYFKTIKHMEYAIKYMKANTKGIEIPSQEILEQHGLV